MFFSKCFEIYPIRKGQPKQEQELLCITDSELLYKRVQTKASVSRDWWWESDPSSVYPPEPIHIASAPDRPMFTMSCLQLLSCAAQFTVLSINN